MRPGVPAGVCVAPGSPGVPPSLSWSSSPENAQIEAGVPELKIRVVHGPLEPFSTVQFLLPVTSPAKAEPALIPMTDTALTAAATSAFFI